MKKIILGIGIVATALAVLGGLKVMQIRKLMAGGGGGQMPPETVSSAMVKEEKWQGTIAAIASIEVLEAILDVKNYSNDKLLMIALLMAVVLAAVLVYAIAEKLTQNSD